MDNQQSLLALPLSNLNKMEIFSKNRHSNIKLFILVIIAGFSIFDLVLLTLQFFYIQRNNFNHYLKNYEGVLLFVQALAKWFSCLYYKNNFMNLIKYAESFWNASKCCNVTKQNVKNLSHRVVNAQKMWVIYPVMAFSLGNIMSVYSKELPIGYWSMGNHNSLFKILWISVLTNTYPMLLVLLFFDILFLGFCFEAILQCRILCNRLEQLNLNKINDGHGLESFLAEMKSCINHHVLLLRFHSEMRKAYSVPLMVQYITNGSYIIVQMYGFSLVSSFGSFMLLFMSNISAVSQTALFCITANHLTDELSLISNAVYNSDWYSQHFSTVSTTVVLMTQRAQQPLSLSACGLLDFNINLLVQVVKFGLSTSIALRNIRSMKQ